MKKLMSLAVVAGLFAATGCNKCLNCDCTWDMTQTVTTVTTDGVGGSDTVINTGTGNGSTAIDGVCDGDDVMINNHMIAAGNIDGSHTYTDTNVDVQDNFLNNGTTTTTTETTTTYSCTCDNA
jgi:hypothetical protein